VTAAEEALSRIHERDEDLNAFVTILEEEARERAREAEEAVEAGDELGPLHGVPIAVKDLFDFKTSVRNTMGSKPFEEFAPEDSATYVERLEDAGAIIAGKTNTPDTVVREYFRDRVTYLDVSGREELNFWLHGGNESRTTV
jgi:Asp-tRNA(Asn)/Glu-tRNA(Gln) amidotransferase A subunit family amidase